jgi:hypothetical protein
LVTLNALHSLRALGALWANFALLTLRTCRSCNGSATDLVAIKGEHLTGTALKIRQVDLTLQQGPTVCWRCNRDVVAERADGDQQR